MSLLSTLHFMSQDDGTENILLFISSKNILTLICMIKLIKMEHGI